jgi:Mrp family chromosome partitioning ATPase
MLVEKLIEELQKLPAQTNVVIADYEKNLKSDSWGEGSSEGLYPKFEIEFLNEDEIKEGTKPFAAMVVPQEEEIE